MTIKWGIETKLNLLIAWQKPISQLRGQWVSPSGGQQGTKGGITDGILSSGLWLPPMAETPSLSKWPLSGLRGLTLVFSQVWLSVTPRTATHQTSLSFAISWSSLRLMSVELVMPANHVLGDQISSQFEMGLQGISGLKSCTRRACCVPMSEA